MPAALKIFACKRIAIKIAFASEAPFPLFIPVNYDSNKFNALNALRIIYEPLCIAGSHLVFQQVRFWNSDQNSIVLIKNFHLVQQYMPYKSHPVLQEIIEKFIMHMHVFKPSFLQVSNKFVYRCCC